MPPKAASNLNAGMSRPGPTSGIACSDALLQLRVSLDDPMSSTFACGGRIVLSDYLPSILSSDSSEDEDAGPESPTPRPRISMRYAPRRPQYDSDQESDPTDDDNATDNDNASDNGDFGGEDLVTIRWDPRDHTTAASKAKLDFPPDPETSQNITQLVQDMHPTDEGYELTPEFFSTTFSPYSCGIIDLAAQALLPGYPSQAPNPQNGKSIEAYLYRLNVHTTKRIMHADKRQRTKLRRTVATWPNQIGHLVVGLPFPHAGGDMTVRCKGARKPATFSWCGDSTPSRQVISWAAFYSAGANCEYDIAEVMGGYRVSLVYNLFRVRGNGQMGDSKGVDGLLDVTSIPMYKTIRAVVDDTVGWLEGGYLGFNCRHSYPHTTNVPGEIFRAPENLVGVDFLMYQIFRSFGLEVQFRPLVRDVEFRGVGGEDEGEGVLDGVEGPKMRPVVGAHYSMAMLRSQHLDVEGAGKMEWAWGKLLEDWAGEYDGGPEARGENWGFLDFDEVNWLNEFGHEEPNIVVTGLKNDVWLWLWLGGVKLGYDY